jgi:ABC-type glycerol-3-phosphate transport system substrate-binding protein
MKKLSWVLILGIFLTLAACAQIPFLDRFQSQVTETAPSMTMIATTPTETATPRSPGKESTSLTIWVPPQFDPQGPTASGGLFKARIEEYLSDRPSLTIDVRVKDLSGPGGILDTLRTAQDAAPLVLPDVVALPRSLMETAAREELIAPFGEYAGLFEGKNWYSFADQLSRIDEETYGIPFAADILIFAYKTDSLEQSPGSWEELLSNPKPMAFPASDPDAFVTFAFYKSAGGNIAALNESYVIDKTPIMEVLSFYQQARQAEVMPYWITQFETDEQAWNAYTERQATQVVTWISNYLQNDPFNTSLGALPTSEGRAFSYATGWVWSIVDKGPEQLDLSAQFIDYLTEDRYLAEWNAEAGFVPPLSSSLALWLTEDMERTLFERILPATVLIPSEQILEKVGHVFQEAVILVLKDQLDPEQAVTQIQEALQNR